MYRYDEENHQDTTVNNENHSTNGTNVDGFCELLTEAFMEVPAVTETNSINSTSQNNDLHDESQLQSTQPSAEGKPDPNAVKQHGKRVLRNTRRSKGRGK